MSEYIHELAMLKIKQDGGIPNMSNDELMEKYLKTYSELQQANKKLSAKYRRGTVI